MHRYMIWNFAPNDLPGTDIKSWGDFTDFAQAAKNRMQDKLTPDELDFFMGLLQRLQREGNHRIKLDQMEFSSYDTEEVN